MKECKIGNLEDSALKINTKMLLQLEKQDLTKIKNIALNIKERHSRIIAETNRVLKDSMQNICKHKKALQ
ncbi:MAG: hypothetical protein MR629_04880 [Helicobacter sp.]|uniref:hypothetical protein n=1 Tax=Helicobacter sp. 10-6591 TaxID=2004998 RepID=UPI000DCF2438|nr:hypothetical protein [Helicobacter sp. 10-6591]MCI6217850.1 hypothetical protein [Helicobacter sp.]MCI7485294.1 hypothetical protein [Helicobacter sp.]MDD7567604.1 hypothetical protein [Helicobacter sp.]MDY5740931.1 hypothetical protein [Helicobacter sp.]RAX55723.1 hypothetical protein CCY97_03135 [Helicobacter sp. 10-6591]